MAPRIVEGIYREGRIELVERPEGVVEGERFLVELTPLPPTEASRRAAGDRLMARLRRGINFGGAPYPPRESLYDRDDRDGSGAR